MDLADFVDVREAAERLGVSEREIYRLVDDGVLSAGRFGGRVAIDEASLRRIILAPRPRGRPFAPGPAWAMLRMLALADPNWGRQPLSASRVSQLRRHLRRDNVDDLAGRLRGRARHIALFVHPSRLKRLDEVDAWIPSGGSALEDVRRDWSVDVVGRHLPAEGYVDDQSLEEVLGPLPNSDAPPGPVNLVAHVVEHLSAVPLRVGLAAPPVVALDLIESGDSRMVGAGLKLWRREVAQWRELHG